MSGNSGEAQSYYRKIGPSFQRHQTVNHLAGEYARADIHTNTVESYFGILKRGLVGTFHHVSETHLQRYVTEFDFRFSHRTKLGYTDQERAEIALKRIAGKRLTYRRPNGTKKAEATQDSALVAPPAT